MKKIYPAIMLALLAWACTKEPVDMQSSLNNSKKNPEDTRVVTPTIVFSGYSWYVKNSGNKKAGPGPNYWTLKNVWVDSTGSLHLLVRRLRGKWTCAEVQSVDVFGDGTYQWQVEGRIDQLDKNVVLGLFNYSGNDGFDEMDIESARWGNTSNPGLNYTVWPALAGFDRFSYAQSFSLNGTYTTHRFTRTKDNVVFESVHGFTDGDTHLFAKATCTNPPFSISTARMPVHMNLWLYQGAGPSDGKPVEIVIHTFRYIPAEAAVR